MSALACKFLAPGALGAISEFAWPRPGAGGEPGAWVEAAVPLAPCASGVHACRAHELAHWLHRELWIVELDGELRDGTDCVIAPRGRLLRPVQGWAEGGSLRFAHAARDHAAQLTAAAPPAHRARLAQYVADASAHLPHGATALAAFCAAMAVAWLEGGDHFDREGYRRERAWQSAFIAADLGLDAVTLAAPGA